MYTNTECGAAATSKIEKNNNNEDHSHNKKMKQHPELSHYMPE